MGMGRDLVRESSAAKAVFDEADDVLGFSISSICFDGPEESLKQTEFTQPAILTNSIAVLRAIQEKHDLQFDVALGHSLGEFSALVAVGALQFKDAVKLVNLRGKAMQEEVPEGVGAMAAIMGLDPSAIQNICKAAAGDEVCEAANLNGGNQIVISGHQSAVERAMAAAEKAGARRVVMLQVSAPFHCILMEPAANALGEALASIEIGEMSVPVISNVEARAYSEKERVKELLVRQVTSSVRWEESIVNLKELGVVRGYELGTGSVLRGLIRRIDREIKVNTTGEPHEVNGWEA